MQEGFFIRHGHQIAGVYSGHDAQRDFTLPGTEPATIYAPTMVSPSIDVPMQVGCLETVTIHWRVGFFGAIEHAHGFWDHCYQRNWIMYKGMGSVFALNYIRIYDGEERYFTEVIFEPTNNRWVGLLYNFQSNLWELQVWVAAGVSLSIFPAGWTQHESYGLQNLGCPSLPSIRSAPVQIFRLTTLQFEYLRAPFSEEIGPPYHPYCFPPYRLRVNQPDWDWEVYYQP